MNLLKTGSINTEYRFKFRVYARDSYKKYQSGFSSWLAWMFRALADRLDGGESIRVFMVSNPVLSDAERARIFNTGMKLSSDLFEEAVEIEAIENGIRESMPELYKGDLQ